MARGASTGRGNYPAARVSGSAEQFKQGIKGVAKIKTPNKHLTENSYKVGLKKVEGDK